VKPPVKYHHSGGIHYEFGKRDTTGSMVFRCGLGISPLNVLISSPSGHATFTHEEAVELLKLLQKHFLLDALSKI
jgi:hypothetical protein